MFKVGLIVGLVLLVVCSGGILDVIEFCCGVVIIGYLC